MSLTRKTFLQILFVCIFSLAAGLGFLFLARNQAQALPETEEGGDVSQEDDSLGWLALARAQEPPDPTEFDFWVVRAYFSERQMVDSIASWKEPWEVDYKQGYLVVGVTPEEYSLLLGLGFRLEIDTKLTAQVNQPSQALSGQTSGIPGYPCYRTVEETYAAAEGIVSDHPQLATWIDIGDTWEKTEPGGEAGYDLMVLRLTNSTVPGPKPKLFAMSSLHAREYAPAELTTRFAEYLVENYGVDADVTWLLDYHEIHLLLQANPDGRKWAEGGDLWRKNTNNNYCSDSVYRGADLNRNFEFEWNCCGGSSGYDCDETYHGPSAASEPETQAIQNYLLTEFPDQREDSLDAPAPDDAMGVFLDIHSFGEWVLWPWGFSTNPAPNNTGLQTLGRKLAYFNDYTPEQAIGLYPTDGTTDAFAYGELGLATYTFELGTTFFQDCSTFEDVILPDNLPALLYAAKTSRVPYQTPAGPDALDLTLYPTFIEAGGIVTLTAQIDDTRFNNANGVEPLQDIVAAEYTIDTPHWVTDTLPNAYPMDALDGSFDSPVEAVVADVDTSGLSGGDHLIFVRGQDAAGNWGVVSAVFVHILTGNEGSFVGNLTDLVTGEPLGGTVYADEIGFSASSDPATGVYTLTMPAGTWDLRASAPLHLDQTADDLTIADGITITQNFALTPTAGLSVDKSLITTTLGLDRVITENLRIENVGNAPLTFSIAERYAGSSASGLWSPTILLVDDDDDTPDVRPHYQAALDVLGYSYDLFDVDGDSGDGPSGAQMAAYDLVIWFSGDNYGFPGKAGPNDYDEAQLAAYLDGGGTLFLSSQDYRYDQGAITPFMSDYLGVAEVIDDQGGYLSVRGQNSFSGMGPYELNYPGVDYSDEITPGSAAVSFEGNNSKNAGVYTQNTVFFAFQWEAIHNEDPANGELVLQAILDHLTGEIPWLDVQPNTGSVAPQGFLDVSLTFSVTAPAVDKTGIYSGSLSVRANDPGNPEESVIVRMIVFDEDAIAGLVRVLGRADHSGALITAWDGATSVAETVTGEGGEYILPVPPGSYRVTVEMERYLDAERQDISQGTLLPAVDLPGGDINDDDCVSALDLETIYRHIGTSEDEPGWDPDADVDADGSVTLRDLRISRVNLGQCSPVPWQ